MNTIERAIPKHLKGIKKHFSASRNFVSVEDAQLCYENALVRLLNINQWHQLSSLEKGSVQVMSEKLKLQRRKVKLGDYVRFGLPAPDNESGAGYDWVHVINLLFSSGKRKEQCLLSLQPCAMPGGTSVAHFFSKESSSNFLITRDGKTITAEYYGQNELPNTDTDGIKNTVRNLAVATGAILGFSGAMWQPMVHALIMDGTKLREQQATETSITHSAK